MQRIHNLGALIPLVALLFGSGATITETLAPSPQVPDFNLQGIAVTECECDPYSCPCRSNGFPTYGGCNSADFVYVQGGQYGNVRLDGLKAVVVGNQLDQDRERLYGTFYYSDDTTPAQREAFTALYKFTQSGSVGGLRYLNRFRVVPVEFTESHDKTAYTVRIPGILEQRVVLKRGKAGKPLHTVPAMDQWGNSIHYADNAVFRYEDREVGRSWDLSGRQANVKYFRVTKRIYEEQELLNQHGDLSGSWMPRQRQIIARMGMKPH